MFDLTTVGHFAIDLISSPTIVSPKLTLGGPPTYTSLAARKLGAKVSVISKVGEDFSPEYMEWLKSQDVNLSGLKLAKGALTTKFILEYGGEERRLRLRDQAPLIYLEDVPNTLQARAIHVAPITNEVGLEVIEKLRTLASILSLDPQGFLKDIPPCRPSMNRDPTGAGDAFIGAFLAEYVSGKDPEWCSCVGSAASSFVVEGIGPAVFGEKEETYLRARQIYGKELK